MGATNSFVLSLAQMEGASVRCVQIMTIDPVSGESRDETIRRLRADIARLRMKPTCGDRQLFYRAFGFWPGEAPREPDDLQDTVRDRHVLSDIEWRRLATVYGISHSSRDINGKKTGR